jgi:hypothetical protein
MRRPKSIVSVLRRGDAFGDQAIINGEPHGTAASPATNVTLLVVTREVSRRHQVALWGIFMLVGTLQW